MPAPIVLAPIVVPVMLAIATKAYGLRLGFIHFTAAGFNRLKGYKWNEGIYTGKSPMKIAEDSPNPSGQKLCRLAPVYEELKPYVDKTFHFTDSEQRELDVALHPLWVMREDLAKTEKMLADELDEKKRAELDGMKFYIASRSQACSLAVIEKLKTFPSQRVE